MGLVGRLVMVKTARGYKVGRCRLIQHQVMWTKAEMAHMMGWVGVQTRVFFSPFLLFF